MSWSLRKTCVRALTVVALLIVAASAAMAGVATELAVDRVMIGEREDVVVHFALRNDSASDLYVVYWLTPARGVLADLFDVRVDGQPVAYVGREYKWATPQPQDFVRIPAGGALERDVELSALYDIARSGEYTVRFRVPSGVPLLAFRDPKAPVDYADLRSNAVDLAIARDPADVAERAARAAAEAQAIGRYVTPGYVSCSSTRQSTLRSALGAAETMSGKARTYLHAGTVGSGYTTWFGAYTASRYSTVRKHFDNIYTVFNAKTVTFYCDCTDSAYAYVYPSQPYKIHLCNAFWSAPLVGIDSKGGTLVHETSHFTVVASTDDWEYGTAACQKLAKSTPKKAIDNADCHEYFAETK